MRSSVVLDRDESQIPLAALALQKGIRLLASATSLPRSPDALPGQPFDRVLLAASPLYRRNRRLFLENGGTFQPALLSSGRALSSDRLLQMDLQYTPLEAEYIWCATDPIEKKEPMKVWALRPYATCLFHEQTHRLLWTLLPPPSAGDTQLRRYMNLCEAMVVAIDAALGDELGSGASEFFYLAGVSHNPGSDLKKRWKPSSREYRNYLQAYMFGVYLTLEDFELDGIRKLIPALFPSLGDQAHHAAERAVHLDRQFVEQTNPFWQSRHARKVRERPVVPPGNPRPLELASAPHDNRVPYLEFEKVLNLLLQ